MNLEGKTAVVTGAGRGIGRACSLKMSEEGIRVAAISRTISDLDSLAKDAEFTVVPYPTDVSDYRQLSETFGRIDKDFGKIDILVAAAGCAWFGDTVSSDISNWDTQISVNLSGLYNSNVLAIKRMLENGTGDIVNILSVISTLSAPGAAAYTASKSGGLGLTRSLSAEYRKQGIRFCALMPGATDTTLWDTLESSLDRKKMMSPIDVAEAVIWVLKRPHGVSLDEMLIMPRDGFL